MKKQYITPASVAVTLAPEQMIATSMNIKVDASQEADQLSNGRQGGWNSDEWSGE